MSPRSRRNHEETIQGLDVGEFRRVSDARYCDPVSGVRPDGICFVCWASVQTPVQPEQTISQRIETTGDVKRLCIEAKTDGRIDAMSCQLIDPMTGGVQ